MRQPQLATERTRLDESGANIAVAIRSLRQKKDEEILVCDYRDGVTHVGPMEREQRRLVKDGLLSAAELMRSEPLRIEGMPPDVIPHEETR